MRPDQGVQIALTQLVLWGPTPSAQAQIRLTEHLSHDISAIESVTLGTAGGVGMILSDGAWPRRAPWGDYFVTYRSGPVLQMFDSTGRLTGRFERPGEGPDELNDVRGIVFSRDSIVAFDAGQPRFVVLDRSLQSHRMASLPVAATSDVLNVGDSLVVLAGRVPDEVHLGNPFQVIDFRGRHLYSFGGSGTRYRVDRSGSSIRFLSTSRPGRFWSARPTVYEIREMALDGTVVRSLVNAPEFFPAPNDGVRHPDRAPPPALIDLQQDASGLLWVLFLVPDPRWSDAVDTAGGFHGGRVTDYDGYYDSVIDVVDPAAGEVVARRRFDPLLLALLYPSSVGYLRYPTPSVPVIQIEDLTLRRRER